MASASSLGRGGWTLAGSVAPGTELADGIGAGDELETELGSWAETVGAPFSPLDALTKIDPARKAPPSRAKAPMVRCDIASSFRCGLVRPGLFRDDHRARPAGNAWQGVSHSIPYYRNPPVQASLPVGPTRSISRAIDRAQGRQILHGPRPLTGLAPRGEFTTDLGSRFVDRAPPIRIEKTAGLVKGQGMESISPPWRLEPGRQLLGLARDSGFPGCIVYRRKNQIGAATRAAAIAFVKIGWCVSHERDR